MARLLSGIGKDLGGGAQVKRFLPNADCASVGPFVFADGGNAQFSPGEGINVRPHPHIGLSTLTYLFEGSLTHRDSLGTVQRIEPGDMNWMTSGRGIVHSERQSIEQRDSHGSFRGLQTWVALPEDKAECEPSFKHFPRDSLPMLFHEKVMIRLLCGEAWGHRSPIETPSPMFYADLFSEQGGVVDIAEPCFASGEGQRFELAVYLSCGELKIGSQRVLAHQMAVLEQDDHRLFATRESRFLLFGGAPLAKKPLLKWNFVAYSQQRLDQAFDDWTQRRFPSIAGDSVERIPPP